MASICVASFPWMAGLLILIGCPPGGFLGSYVAYPVDPFVEWLVYLAYLICGVGALRIGSRGMDPWDAKARSLSRVGMFLGWINVGIFALLLVPMIISIPLWLLGVC